jgi:tagatose 1,6-diphosphate aldolase
MTLPSITPGKIRGLSATSSAHGVFHVLAVDHRDSLRVVIDPERPDSVPAAALTAVKLDLIREIGEAATAVMLDPEYSIAQAITTRSLSGRVGFIAALEAQGYLGDPAAVQTFLLDDWSVEKAKRTGADAVKLLVLYRPDAGEVTDSQDEVIKQVIDACARHDMAIFLEPLAYPLAVDGNDDIVASVERRRRVVIDSVRRLGALGPDVLKIQFPVDTQRQQDRAVWRDACAELDDIAPVPWVLLSAGDPYELFCDQVQIACQGGASGFLAGRALWGDYVLAAPADRAHLMEHTVLPRFAELAGLASEYGRDWASRYQMPEPDERWFTTY